MYHLLKKANLKVLLCVLISLACSQIIPSMMAAHNNLSLIAQWQSDLASCVILTVLFGAVFFIASLRLLELD